MKGITFDEWLHKDMPFSIYSNMRAEVELRFEWPDEVLKLMEEAWDASRQELRTGDT